METTDNLITIVSIVVPFILASVLSFVLLKLAKRLRRARAGRYVERVLHGHGGDRS